MKEEDVDVLRMAKETGIYGRLIREVLRVESISTVKEARYALETPPGYTLDSALEAKLLKKWDELSLREVEKASTIEELKTAYYEAPTKGEARLAAIRKLATFFKKSKKS